MNWNNNTQKWYDSYKNIKKAYNNELISRNTFEKLTHKYLDDSNDYFDDKFVKELSNLMNETKEENKIISEKEYEKIVKDEYIKEIHKVIEYEDGTKESKIIRKEKIIPPTKGIKRKIFILNERDDKK
ncbi:MAG: hypothetical protein ACOCP8_01395 [archaeon]